MKKTIVLLLLAAGLLGEAFGLVALARGQQASKILINDFGPITVPAAVAIGGMRDSNGCYGMFHYDPSQKVCIMHIWFMPPPPSKVSCTLRDSNAEEKKMGYMQTIDCTAAPDVQHR